METVILVDVFQQASWTVVLAGLTGSPVCCARGVRLVADAAWEDVEPNSFDAIVLPGGSGGAERMRRHAGLCDALRRAMKAGKRIGAICAGPWPCMMPGFWTAARPPAIRDSLTGPDPRDWNRRPTWCGMEPFSQAAVPGPAWISRWPWFATWRDRKSPNRLRTPFASRERRIPRNRFHRKGEN